MITAIVRYKPARALNREEVDQMMKYSAANVFKGVPGLYSKQFCFDVDSGEGFSVYLWESREIAQAFFSEAFLDNFKKSMGCEPVIQYWDTIAVVDNRSGEVLPAA